MDVTFPQDLHDLKIRVDHWRTTRWFIREALPKELRDAITESLSPSGQTYQESVQTLDRLPVSS
jgi:hypothetical protein